MFFPQNALLLFVKKNKKKTDAAKFIRWTHIHIPIWKQTAKEQNEMAREYGGKLEGPERLTHFQTDAHTHTNLMPNSLLFLYRKSA